jgi:cytochrome c oxidase subunit IV
VKKLDVLLMVLSCLFPIAGVMNQFPLKLSLIVGGLLFLISLGSYFAKRTYLRVFSWMAYAVFIAFLLFLRNPYITTSSMWENIKISVCIALIPFLFRFRTYAITIGLLGLWGVLLWDVKQAHSLVVLQRIMQLATTERLYLLTFVAGFLFGGWLGNATKQDPKREKQEKSSRPKQRKHRKRWRITIPIPSLPKIKMKALKPRHQSSARQETRLHESKQEENTEQNNKTKKEEQDKGTEFTLGETRMERRKNKYNA